MIPVSRWMDDGTRREGTCEADDEAPSPPAEGEMARARERQTSERVAACRGEREAGRKHACIFLHAWWSARVHWQARLCSDAELRTDSSSLLCSTGGPCRESGGDAHGSTSFEMYFSSLRVGSRNGCDGRSARLWRRHAKSNGQASLAAHKRNASDTRAPWRRASSSRSAT